MTWLCSYMVRLAEVDIVMDGANEERNEWHVPAVSQVLAEFYVPSKRELLACGLVQQKRRGVRRALARRGMKTELRHSYAGWREPAASKSLNEIA